MVSFPEREVAVRMDGRGRFDLRSERMVCCEVQQKLHRERKAITGKEGAVAPYSCLVAAMGNHWEEGCYEAVNAMAHRLHEEGYMTLIHEEFDMCYTRGDALGSMRNRIYQKAIAEGWEWLCYVDNDVKPESDLLMKLMAKGVPIIGPVVRYASGAKFDSVAQSRMERDKGLVMVDSILLSLFLCRPQVFMPWFFSGFWENPIGATEEHHWDKMFLGTGHRPFVDTDSELLIMKEPWFPLEPEKQSVPSGSGPVPLVDMVKDAPLYNRREKEGFWLP